VTWTAISFDLDDTLVDREAAVRGLLASCVAEGIIHDALQIDDGGRGTPRLVRWLSECSPTLGCPAEVARWFRRTLPRFVHPDPAVTQAAYRIAARHRTAVVSNGGRGQRRKLAAAGLTDAFEHVVVSSEVRARKPSAAIFERAAVLLAVEPSEILHVGNDPLEDIAGAAMAGLATCWIARGRSFPCGLPRPLIVVDHVAELPEVLSC